MYLPRIWTGNALSENGTNEILKKKKVFVEKHYF